MNDFTGRVKRDEWHPPNGFRRTVTVAMDTAQYQMDINQMQATKGEDLYGTFNLVMRRKPKVKAICALWFVYSVRRFLCQRVDVVYSGSWLSLSKHLALCGITAELCNVADSPLAFLLAARSTVQCLWPPGSLGHRLC